MRVWIITMIPSQIRSRGTHLYIKLFGKGSERFIRQAVRLYEDC